MSPRLITFLGKGQYTPTTYAFNGELLKTCYVARALATFLEADEVYVFATKEAWAQHSAPLTEEFLAAGLPQPRCVSIGLGGTPDQLWQQFEVLLDKLDCERSIAFDITHGYRSQPFFASAVVQFFQSIHPVYSDLHVYYGAYEARNMETNESPILDLTVFVELLRWARALLLFLQTGRADDIADPTERLGKELQKQWALDGRRGKKPSLAALGKALQRFGDDFATMRIGSLVAHQRSSSQQLLDGLERAKSDVATHLPPLASVLDRVIDLVKPLAESVSLSDSTGQRALQSLAKTYLSMGRYAEAAATLREGWITRYACSQSNQPGADGFSMARREAAENEWFHHDEDLAKSLADLRNDIEHAGFRRDPRQPTNIKKQLEEMIDKWCALEEEEPRHNSVSEASQNREHESSHVTFYSIGVEEPVVPEEPLPPLPEIPRGALVVVEGRAPIWRYGMAFHRLHGSPAGAVAMFDPRLGAVVVASHHPNWREGQVIDVEPPSRNTV